MNPINLLMDFSHKLFYLHKNISAGETLTSSLDLTELLSLFI